MARRVEERVGPDLDLDADDIEAYAKDAACAAARGAIEELLEKKAAALSPQQPCPECQRLCPVEREPRTISFWGGPITYREPKSHSPACRRDFFSPSVLRKIALATARHPSFQEAAAALLDMAEVTISDRQVTRIATEIGHELEAERDRQTQRFEDRRLTPAVTTRPALAVVETDGGRLRVRGEGTGPGAHAAAWREDKVALLSTAARNHFETDPEPELPACFRDRARVEKLARDIGGVGSLGFGDAPPQPAADASDSTRPAPDAAPELLTRTYVATMRDSEAFGAMVAAEAHWRSFQAADRGAFVGDGAAWLWKLHRRRFPEYTPIAAFTHAFGYVFAAARAATTEPAARWAQYSEWIEACWQGRATQVIQEIRGFQERLGASAAEEFEALAEDDPRIVLPRCVTYLEHNASRMDYPRYRREGLPTTSSHAESPVNMFNSLAKGSEKSWGSRGAEAMLQLRAAYLSEDGRLERHQKSRTYSPYRTYKTRRNGEAA